MKRPVFIEHMVVLSDLKIGKSTDSLDLMLENLPSYAAEMVDAPHNTTGFLRQIMYNLLKTEDLFHYFQRMLDCLGPKILLHRAYEGVPHLLTCLVKRMDEDYIMELYRQIDELPDIEEYAYSAYGKPFKRAFYGHKYRLIRHLYEKGTDFQIQVDEDVCGGDHPLCFYTDFCDPEAGRKFAQAYLEGTSHCPEQGLCHSNSRFDPQCVYAESLLEHIVKSDRCDIMELVLRYRDIRLDCLTREGYSLLDVAPSDQMRDLVFANGAEKSHALDVLLHKSILAVQHQAPDRLVYITKLLEHRPLRSCTFYFDCHLTRHYKLVRLLTEALAFCDVEVLEHLALVLVSQLHSQQTINGLSKAVYNCTYGYYDITCDKLVKMLKLLVDWNLRFDYENVQVAFIRQAIHTLIVFDRTTGQTQTQNVITICKLLCTIFKNNPVALYRQALDLLEDDYPTYPQVKALFQTDEESLEEEENENESN